MNKEEIIKVINQHMKPKDVGIAVLVCISEPEQVEKLAEELEQLALLRVSERVWKVDEIISILHSSEYIDEVARWFDKHGR